MVVPVMPGMFPLPGYVAPTPPGGPGPGMPPPNATPEPPPTPVPTVTPGSVSYGIVGSKLDANDLVDATDESGRAVLTRIPARARVEVLRASRIGDRSVHLVRYGKVIGYVLSDQLELRLSGEPEPVTPTPAAGATPARGLPSLVTIAAGNARVKIYNNAEMGREITTVAPGTKATVLDAEGATYKVRLPDGGTGFVLKKLTDFP